MAYQTGTATDINDLFNKLADFAIALNWRINKHSTNSLYLNNKDGYWALEFKDKMLFTLVCTGYDKDRDAFNQPGASCNHNLKNCKTQTTHLDEGNYVGYDFFGTAQYLHVVVQYQAERFRHFGIGTLNKEGEYTGGQYAFGTYVYYSDYERPRLSNYHTYGFSAGYDDRGPVLRADNIAGDTRSPWYFTPHSQYDWDNIRKNEYGNYLLTLGRIDSYQHHPDAFLLSVSQSQFGQALIPCPHSLIGQCKDGLFRRFGVIADRYECKMVGVLPRQKLQINGESWMIIPSAQYQTESPAPAGNDNSGQFGVAYRIVE